MPMVAVVERDPNLSIGGRIEETFLTRIFADGVSHRAAIYAAVDLRPCLAAIVGAPQVWVHVIEPQGVGGGVCRRGVEVARVHVKDATPWLDLRRSDIGPMGAAVGGELDETVAGARPKHVDVERRRRERGNGALRRGRHGSGILAGVSGHVPGLAGQIAADRGPAMSAVGSLPHAGRGVKENIGVLGRPDKRLRANGAGGRLTGGALRGRRRATASAPASTARANVGFLSGEAVIDSHFPAVDQIGVFRVRSSFAVLFDTHRMPIVKGD